jgi:hypothetical protein
MKFQSGTEMIEPLSNEQIECLNSWPAFCRGHAADQKLVQLLNELCINHGYGRISQLVQALEEIWRNPEDGGKKHQEFHDERMELLKGTIEQFQEFHDERMELLNGTIEHHNKG